MSDWTRTSIRKLLDNWWPGEWGYEFSSQGEKALVYRSTDLDDEGHLLENGGVERFLHPAKLHAKKLRPGDVLLEASGGAPDRPVGRTALFTGSQDKPSVAANFIRTLRPKEEVSSAFLNFALLHLHKQPEIWRYQQQTTGMSNLKVADYLRHEIAVPSPPVQEKIAEILGTVDQAITETHALIAKLQQVKSGVMHDLFTRGVTPGGLRPTRGEAPHLYKKSSLGWIPRDWEATKLGRLLVRIDAGKSPDCPDTSAHGDQWGVLKVSALHPDGLRTEENKVVIDDAQKDASYLIRKDDLLLSRANTTELVGAVCHVTFDPPTLMLSDKSLRLVVDRQLSTTRFVFWALQIGTIRRQIQASATGSSGSMKNITQMQIRSILLPLPPPPSLSGEQSQIADLLDKCHDDELALLQMAKKLRSVKSALMHDLVTGRVPVNAPNEDAPAI